MEFRSYDPKRDEEAVHRIWREIGWLKEGQEEAMDLLIGCGRAHVAEIDGQAESLAMTAPGTIRYLDEELPFSAVIGVSTGWPARGRGLASRLTARAVAADAAAEALVAGLGMFEQGYYNQLGFGTGPYEHWLSFDPAQLDIEMKPPVPRRLAPEDWELVHKSRLARSRGHGACNLIPPETTRAEMLTTKNGFGLGYERGGELTHHLWCSVRDVEQGPYTVRWMAYRTPEQFLELLALLKSLGDQVQLVRLCEPQGVQLQDLLARPFRYRELTRGAKFEQRMSAAAYWQLRILDLRRCLERTHLRGDELRFNLRLDDPIARFLDEGAPWRGLSGEYVVTLGPSSGAEPGQDEALPTLRASVGAFSRLWLGVRPATGLAVTDELSGPQELLERLDRVLCLPEPKWDWDF